MLQSAIFMIIVRAAGVTRDRKSCKLACVQTLVTRRSANSCAVERPDENKPARKPSNTRSIRPLCMKAGILAVRLAENTNFAVGR